MVLAQNLFWNPSNYDDTIMFAQNGSGFVQKWFWEFLTFKVCLAQ
jgi:hypothetical protein